MPPVQGAATLPSDNVGNQQWGIYELGNQHFWFPAGWEQKLTGGGVWALAVGLSAPSNAGAVQIGSVDGGVFTPGATSGVLPVGFVVDETGPAAVAEGSQGAPRMTAARIIRVAPSLSDGAGGVKDEAANLHIPASTFLAPATGTANRTSADVQNPSWKGASFSLTVDTIVSTGTVDCYVRNANTSAQILQHSEPITADKAFTLVVGQGATMPESPAGHIAKVAGVPLPAAFNLLLICSAGLSARIYCGVDVTR